MKKRHWVGVAVLLTTLVQPVLAQNATAVSDICNNQLVQAMNGLITLLAAVGPVVGALVAMAAMLVLSTTQNPRKKKKWIKTRNDAIKYGVGILFIGAIMNLLVQVTNPQIASCVSVIPG
ncbi:MAG: hypothetical protein SXQ77_08255 [Halobacteria archaeon]|nr:hypothetical protein [Halobacteria archaeon]